MNAIQKFGKMLYKWWMAFAHVLAVVNTTILLTIVYTFFIGIASIVIRILRKDPMRHRIGPENSYWKTRDVVQHTIEQARHQF